MCATSDGKMAMSTRVIVQNTISFFLPLTLSLLFLLSIILAASENAFASTNATDTGKYVFVKKWGSQGIGNTQFNNPTSIALDPTGNVYVLDTGNNRIQKFDSDGNSLTSWPTNGTINSNTQTNNLQGIAVDFSGNVYQSGAISNKIFKYTTDGSFVKSWGSNGQEVGQFSNPTGIATYSSGNNVYVIDFGNHRIQKFDSNGNFITKWGSQGSGDGQFKNPTGIAVDSIGYVYVIDSANNHIQKFDSAGKLITKWGSAEDGNNQLQGPTGIAVDSIGYVYVLNAGNSQIKKFDNNGNFIVKWSFKGTGDGQLNNPTGIAVDNAGNVYVADTGNNRIEIFSKVNGPPIANAGPSQTVKENATVTLDGSKSYDPDGNKIISYSWKQVFGIPVVFLTNNNNSNNSSTPSFTAPHTSNNTLLKFSLTVTDDKGMISNNTNNIVAVTVKPVIASSTNTTTSANILNQELQSISKQKPQLSQLSIPKNQSKKSINKPPIADAGLSQEVHEGYVILLNGTKSTDPDSGDNITYSWRQIEGPAVKLDNTSNVSPLFIAPNVSTDTKLVFELTVKDNDGLKGTSTVTVTDKHNVLVTPATTSLISPPSQTPIIQYPIANNGNTTNSKNQSTVIKSSIKLSSMFYNNMTLIHNASKINSADPSSRYNIRVWLDAPAQVLSNIYKVVYNPQPAKYFPDGNQSSISINDNFAGYWKVWGEFPLTANVYFKDGSITELSRYISFSSNNNNNAGIKLSGISNNNLSTINSNANVYPLELMYKADPIPSDQQMQSGDKHLYEQITVWINTSPEIMKQIERVIYNPQPPNLFPPPIIATDPSNSFKIIGWQVWGTFDLKATVIFKDGQYKNIETFINF
ncbi:MAG: pYEATS domain-containing protein [Candidatus Nitrosocosmicus sp.]